MPDVVHQIAFDPSAPADERTGAAGELQKSAMSGLGQLIPAEDVMRVIGHMQQQWEEMDLRKAINPVVVPFPSARSRAGKDGMQSVRLDDWSLSIQGEYWDRPSALTFDSMRSMVEQTPVLNAVVMTRVRQVQRFCRAAESDTDKPGFQICHVDRKHQLTASERESIELLQKFIGNCGWESSPRRRKALRRDSFSQFMARSVRDSLVMDSAPIETEFKRDRKAGLDGFYAVDGATIRLCTEHGYRGDDELFALQVIDGRISTAYTFEDLIYESRNPRTDVRSCGYGISETELLVRTVTGFLNAMTYNIKGFDSNSIPKGMLHLTGNYQQADIDTFKRYWNNMVRGVNNAWSLPVMVSKDQESKAAFERFGVEYDEMAFSKWMTFLTSIICAIYGMSPAEINFDSFTAGSTSALAGSDTSEKLAASKDSGLRPLLSFYESTISDFIVGDFSDRFVFRWTGLDPRDAQQRFEMRKLILTVNEARAEEGYEKMDGPLGDAPLNPAMLGAWQQAQGGGDGHDFGDESAAGASVQPGDDGHGGPGDGHGGAGDGHGGQEKPAGYDEAKPADDVDQRAEDERQQAEEDVNKPSKGDEFGKSFGLPEILSIQ